MFGLIIAVLLASVSTLANALATAVGIGALGFLGYAIYESDPATPEQARPDTSPDA
jgi:uncharacterized membrane protein YebE (DUF533 family)